ncbi:hypothetical protein [[Kitasatospora] papulosa]|uniref:hypothetical protein n=1 Tax=[Kitasatospora] papulosa TaxID=1464011 RepID=UPI002E142BC4|nr:hypothetical protein OG483_00270 [[Kitasatospora] papulosa]
MIKTALRRGAEADVGVPYVKPDQRGDAGACVQKAAQLAGYGIVRDGVYGQATYAPLTDSQ